MTARKRLAHWSILIPLLGWPLFCIEAGADVFSASVGFVCVMLVWVGWRVA